MYREFLGVLQNESILKNQKTILQKVIEIIKNLYLNITLSDLHLKKAMLAISTKFTSQNV